MIKKYLILFIFIFPSFGEENKIILLPKNQENIKVLDKKYEDYKEEKYKLPPSAKTKQEKKKKKGLDFDMSADVDTEKKELKSVKLGVGTKF